MKALSVAWKDLQILFKDRGSVLYLFLVPIAFIFVFSGALGQLDQPAQDQRLPLPVVNLDPGGQAAEAFSAGLNAAGGIVVVPYAEADALAKLRAETNREIDRVLIIPAGFTSDTGSGKLATLRLISHPEADEAQTRAIRLVVEGVADDMALETQLVASLERMADMVAADPAASQAFTKERIVAQARAQFAAAAQDPLVSIRQSTPGAFSQQEEATPISDVRVRVAGFTVLFAFLAAQATARSVYEEKKGGSFRRLLAAPISKASLLAGKMLPNLAIVLLQIAVIFAFGMFVLPLLGMERLTLGRDVLGVGVVSLLVALCSTSLGVLIAALSKTEGQVGGIASLIIWAMGIVGGSLVPLYLFTQGPISQVGKVVPVHWANEAYYGLMVRGLTLADIGPALLALAGFTAAFLAIGLWRFDFD